MLALSTTTWWTIGIVIGVAVVLIVALLLIAIILLARRIARQAADITAALDGARRNTTPLFATANVNHALERITTSLRALRGVEKLREDSDVGWIGRLGGRLASDGEG